MTALVKEAADLLEVLPEKEQDRALEFIRRLVLAWDPEYIRLTDREKKRLDDAEQSILEEGTLGHEEINWD